MSLRIAMVVDRFPAEPFIAQQIAALLERSVDVHVFCQIHDKGSPAQELLSDVDMTGRIHPWPDRGENLALAAAATRTLFRSFRRGRAETMAAIRSERNRRDGRFFGRVLFDARLLAVDPDVVHFQFGDLALRRIHVASSLDVAFTASFRGYDLAYAGQDIPGYYEALWPVLDGAHTLGQDLLRLAEVRGAPPSLEWTIIPPAVDSSRFVVPGPAKLQPVTGRPIRVLSVGRLHWKKGFVDGLKAVAELVRTGQPVEYRIVGAGPAEEELRWTIEDLGLGRSVRLCGELDQRGVREQLAWAEIFLHPALTEGFGNAVLEAQAMAVPVVCTDAEGLGENVVDGETGLVVPRRSPDRLAAALAELTRDPSRRLAMGRRGSERVASDFCIEDQTDHFIDFFTRAATVRAKRS